MYFSSYIATVYMVYVLSHSYYNFHKIMQKKRLVDRTNDSYEDEPQVRHKSYAVVGANQFHNNNIDNTVDTLVICGLYGIIMQIMVYLAAI